MVQRVREHQPPAQESANPYDEGEKKQLYEAMTEWMFISIDKEGKVLINHVFRQYLFTRVKKYTLIEPGPAPSRF